MRADVVIVGGGLIGQACAWRAAEAGLEVTVVDAAPGTGASGVAAGMLAPVTEVTYGEQALLRLGIASRERWPSFAHDLEAATGRDVGYRADGTLLVAYDADDRRLLGDLQGFMGELGLVAEALRSRACREREPLLSPRIRGGLLASHDHQVDPRRVLTALRLAGDRAGVRIYDGRVATIDHDGGAVRGVTLIDGSRLDARRVVLAAGVWSGEVGGLPEDVRPPLRPVKGQILRVRTIDGEPLLRAAVRGIVRGRSIYLVPRAHGEIVIGATQEERGFDVTVTAGGVRELLDDAVRVVPGVDETALVEVQAGLRPATPDNRPLVGRAGPEGLLVATGHFRNGVLLTPITAEAIRDLLIGVAPDPVIHVADPGRPGLHTRRARSTAGPPPPGHAVTEGARR